MYLVHHRIAYVQDQKKNSLYICKYKVKKINTDPKALLTSIFFLKSSYFETQVEVSLLKIENEDELKGF